MHLHLDERSLPIRPGQTLLDALEAAGEAWPSHCRVGACGTCRCRIRDGRVHERTESAYLLSPQEIAAGVVLACQTEARGDLAIERPDAAAIVAARVEAIHAPSATVRELVLRPEAPVDFAAGQYATLHLPAMGDAPAVSRPYSFATPPRADGCLHFSIRLHPGGAFSEALIQHLRVGDAVRVEGPSGAFRLPAGAGPLWVLGAGTGVPPLVAMLESALAAGEDTRPVHVLVAARSEDDLPARPRLEALAARWRGPLRVLPVLSRPDAGWSGERGRLAERLPGLLDGVPLDGASAAVCGPVGFVDAVAATLIDRGLPIGRLALDRFVPAGSPTVIDDAIAAPAADASDRTVPAPSSILHALKFSLFLLIGLAAIASIALGGAWTTWGLLVIVATYVLGDALLGDDTSIPAYRHPGALTALLWSALPLVAAVAFVAVWRVSPGDPLGFGAALQALSGVDVLAARDASGPGSLVATGALAGLMIGMLATVPAHELVHRTWDPRSMAIGRALLAFSFDTSFAIEHVHGHHRSVATTADPASAPRGRNVYAHILHSTWHGNASAWRIEAARLAKRGLGPWSPRNAVLRGWALSALLVAAAAAMGGLAGALFFAAFGLWGKALLEIVNYMEHYGLARDPATPVQPRHSWNTNRRVSSWSLFNLTRHSHHHAQGEVPFHELRPMPDAPMMPSGYLSTILLTLVPPLWKHLMAPRLADWDARFATPVERALARANAEG